MMKEMQLDGINFRIQALQHRIERLEKMNDKWTYDPNKGNGVPNAGILDKLNELYDEMDNLLEQRSSRW